MTLPSIPSITSAQTNLVNAMIQQETIQADLSKALKSLSKDPDLALMQIMMILGNESGGTIGMAENGVDQDAQKMNMMTKLATYTKNITEDINTISSSSSTAAEKSGAASNLIQQCSALKTALGNTNITWKNPITGKTETQSWISPAMATKALDSLNSFVSLIGGGGAPNYNPTNGNNVVNNIQNWIKNPTSGTPTGQENIQSMNKDVAIMSNLFQGLSTSAQNVVKEGNTTLTQYQSNEGTLFTDMVALNKAIVAHLGGN